MANAGLSRLPTPKLSYHPGGDDLILQFCIKTLNHWHKATPRQPTTEGPTGWLSTTPTLLQSFLEDGVIQAAHSWYSNSLVEMSTKLLQQTLHANKTIQRLLSMDHMPYNMGVSKNRGGPPKWMFYNGTPNSTGYLGGPPLFLETPIYQQTICQQTIQQPATNQVAMTHPHIVATIGNQCFPLLLYQPV